MFQQTEQKKTDGFLSGWKSSRGKFIMLEIYQEYRDTYRISANREKDPMSLDELNSYLNEIDAKIVGKGLSVKL